MDAQAINDALILVCRHGLEDVARFLLINGGAEVNAKDASGNTALMWACENNHREVTILLLENNALMHLRNKKKDTALTLARKYKHWDVVKLLSNHNRGSDGTEQSSQSSDDNITSASPSFSVSEVEHNPIDEKTAREGDDAKSKIRLL